jgi:hypothetical protein
MSDTTFRTGTTVGVDGRVEMTVPLPPGTAVEVIVQVPTGDDCRELVQAAQSALGFWDNPEDDEDWNDASTR